MSDIIRDALYGASVFLDETKLYPEFVPDKLPHREDVIRQLASHMRPLITGQYGTNIAVTGPAGVGKTVTVKRTMFDFARTLKESGKNISYAYYNCYTFRTKTAILRNLLSDKFQISTRGFSDEEILEMLMKRLDKEQKHLLVVLDEASMLKSDEIRTFIHAGEYFGQSRINLILISRPEEWITKLDAALSGHIHAQIKIQGYSKVELTDILDFRSRMAFKGSAIDEELVHMVAEIAAQTQNARHGIEILLGAGKLADYERAPEVTAEHVRKAKAEIYPELRTDVLENLEIHELITLMAITRRLKHSGISATTIKEIQQNYRLVCEEYNEDPRSSMSLRKYVDRLEQIQIIGKVTGPIRGSKGRRSRITIYDAPASVLLERVLKLLEERLN